MRFKKTSLLYLFLAMASFASCQTSKVSKNLNSSDLFQHWIHSHEEDTLDIKTYRTTTYDFPPSRGRVGLEFKKNGTYIEYKIGANDAPVALIGNFSQTKTDNFILTPTDKSKKSREFQLVELNKDFIKIKWIIGI